MDKQNENRLENIESENTSATGCGNGHSCCGGEGHSEGDDHNCGCNHDGEDHNCGCGHDHEHHNSVTLELEDGKKLVCPVIDLFEVNGKEYIALLHPVDHTALLYGFFDYEDGTVELTDIEEDNYDIVSEKFLALQEEMEDEE